MTLRRDVSVLIVLGLVFTLAGLYCASGYAMNASFSVAHPEAQMIYRRRAVIWLVAAGGSFVVALASFVGCILRMRTRKLTTH